jgi:hypothetical protein
MGEREVSMADKSGAESALPQVGDKKVFKLTPLSLRTRAKNEITCTYGLQEKKRRCVRCGYDGTGWWTGECSITDDMNYPWRSHIAICPLCGLCHEKIA